jgi:hypothetical protein
MCMCDPIDPERDAREAAWLRRCHRKEFIRKWWWVPFWIALMLTLAWLHYVIMVA